ncbi:GTPase [Anabaena azotica]|uniref:50S ribosome-binding GTPase n=1 Tax=Anabaena azotica FACHB-119 TaxID=947527 RepID=A0ABR8DDD2_9NOST|nr:GTPase [Anabaena azotica]MBD2505245.1 50S ribosome-binding GTPase [Anabaena azotica FACHB-119]
MSEFKFKQVASRVKNLCSETLKILYLSDDNEIKEIAKDFDLFIHDYQQKRQLTVAFIGQYNAGKSTLIKAITGDISVKISAEICTDRITEYSWKEVLLVDTPGVYAGRTEHDQITLEAISKSDLLVFVVPNELFNPQGGAFFKRVANEMQRVGQMLLVINKMSRETGKPEDLLKTILTVIEPHHPNDFYTCFIDADSDLKARLEKDLNEKEFLLEESNFTTFLLSLHRLIDKNKLYARLLTPLNRALDILEKSLNILSTGDKSTRDILEILHRKILLIKASQIRFKNFYIAEFNNLEHEVIMIGEGVASKVDGRHSEKDINLQIKQAEKQIESATKGTIEKIQLSLEEELSRLQTQLEHLLQSRLGRSLAEEVEISSTNKKQVDYEDVGEAKKIPSLLRKSPEAVRAIGGFSSAVSRDLVYNVGKFFGVKFKPWGAVNSAKFIRGLGPIIGGVGAILEIFLAAKQEKDEAEYEQKLREARAELRQSFRQVALEIRSEYEKNIQTDIISGFYNSEIQDIEHQQHELRDNESSKSEVVNQIENLIQKIKKEITTIDNIA